jgi:type IV pilus assembly protein PilV
MDPSPHPHPAAPRGFSMIEVLVTMALVAFGLLGTASLLLHAFKMNQGGLLRTQALTALGDITERLEANRPGAIAGLYGVGTTSVSAAKDCSASSVVCNASELAQYDLQLWQQQVAQLPGGSSSITLAAAGNPATYNITINWVDRRTSNKISYSTTGTDENFSVSATKAIYCVSGGAAPC